MNLPDIESLRCFDAAATHLNFRAAAHAVSLSPSAFSERIVRLEEQLEVKLFERTTRRVTLTTAGRRLQIEVGNILGLVVACTRVGREDGQLPPFGLTIGTRFELGLSWLVPSLDTLKTTRPERNIDLIFGDSPALIHHVKTGAADAFISSVRLTQRGLHFAPLHEERYVFVGTPKCLKSPIKSSEDAQRHRLLDMHPELPLFKYFLDSRPPSEDWAFSGREHLGTIGAVKFRVLAHAGVGVLPRYFVENELKSGKLLSIFPDTEPVKDVFRLIWRANHPMESELRALAVELSNISLQ